MDALKDILLDSETKSTDGSIVIRTSKATIKTSTTIEQKVDFDFKNSCDYFETRLLQVTKNELTALSIEYGNTNSNNTNDTTLT